jgi:hypothetical protein
LVFLQGNEASSTTTTTNNHHTNTTTTTVLLEQLQQCLHEKLQSLQSMTAGGGTTTSSKGFPIQITFQIIPDTTVGYTKLVQHLVHQSLRGTIHQPQQRLRIDLPETTDGVQCQFDLAVQYHVLPTLSVVHNVDYWQMLVQDLHTLCTSSVVLPLQVQQLIPYTALDASLLFGIPMRVTAHGTTTTHFAQVEDYHTMQVLFTSFLRLLQDRELVVLLKVASSSSSLETTTSSLSGEAGSGSSSSRRTTSGGVMLAQPGQTLVLMPRETTRASTAPQSALLWGYATPLQWLNDDSEISSSSLLQKEEALASELTGYIDASLDQVFCGPYNPLVDKATRIWKDGDTFTTTTSSSSLTCPNTKDEDTQQEEEEEESMEDTEPIM